MYHLSGHLYLFFGCEQEFALSFTDSQDFTNGLGLGGQFADYPAGSEGQLQLESELALLPGPLDNTKPAFRVSGVNRDDLLMFIYQSLRLKPITEYAIVFTVQLASQYPENSIGIGGSPGASVFLKAGAKGEAPLLQEDAQGMIRISNYDLGNQSTEEDGLVLGSIGIPGDDLSGPSSRAIMSDNNLQPPLMIRADVVHLWDGLWI